MYGCVVVNSRHFAGTAILKISFIISSNQFFTRFVLYSFLVLLYSSLSAWLLSFNRLSFAFLFLDSISKYSSSYHPLLFALHSIPIWLSPLALRLPIFYFSCISWSNALISYILFYLSCIFFSHGYGYGVFINTICVSSPCFLLLFLSSVSHSQSH